MTALHPYNDELNEARLKARNKTKSESDFTLELYNIINTIEHNATNLNNSRRKLESLYKEHKNNPLFLKAYKTPEIQKKLDISIHLIDSLGS